MWVAQSVKDRAEKWGFSVQNTVQPTHRMCSGSRGTCQNAFSVLCSWHRLQHRPCDPLKGIKRARNETKWTKPNFHICNFSVIRLPSEQAEIFSIILPSSFHYGTASYYFREIYVYGFIPYAYCSNLIHMKLHNMCPIDQPKIFQNLAFFRNLCLVKWCISVCFRL